MLKLQLSNGQIIEVEEGSTLLPLAQKLSDKYASPIVMGLYNGEECDLQRPLTADGTVDFVEVNNSVGMRVYVRTLLFMLIAATKSFIPMYIWRCATLWEAHSTARITASVSLPLKISAALKNICTK